MESKVLSNDTKTMLLLCSRLGQRVDESVAPLKPSEYIRLETVLAQHGFKIADLVTGSAIDSLSAFMKEEDFRRIRILLTRGAAMGFAVERWTNAGLWITGRNDPDYPSRLIQRLGNTAPPVLYGAGRIELVDGPGLAVVGSRDADEEGLEFAGKVGRMCAKKGITIVSGAAKGIDRAAMNAAIEAGGTAVGVLSDGLLNSSTQAGSRELIRDGELLFLSPYEPDAIFSIGNAMGRNKYIYALSEWALVVSSAAGKGGTWAGAEDNLKHNWVPLFVRAGEGVPEGNRKLLEKGAIPLTAKDLDECDDIGKSLAARSGPVKLPFQESREEPAVSTKKPHAASETSKESPVLEDADLFPHVLLLILKQLQTPRTGKELGEILKVKKAQMTEWLQRALDEGKIRMIKKGSKTQYALPESPQLTLIKGIDG
jgi:predicted Rossmann fold nucleotide-binding protein DprA/Smf involved in DNA uptake